MHFEINYSYSPEFAKKVAVQFLWLKQGWLKVVMIIFLCITSIIYSSSVQSRWFGGFLAAVLVYFTFQWVNYVRNSVKSANEMTDQLIIANIDDDGVVFKSSARMSVIKWQNFSEIWKTKTAWMFFYSINTYTAVPSNSINDDLAKFIINRASALKIKVINFGKEG